jgi:hypothetical protein
MNRGIRENAPSPPRKAESAGFQQVHGPILRGIGRRWARTGFQGGNLVLFLDVVGFRKSLPSLPGL